MNFLEAYREFTKESEPPQAYHTWTAISVAGALLGRKCHMPMGYFNVYPNLYVLLVGIPGMRKSTALSTGRKILSASKLVPIAASSTTREALIENIAEDTSTVKHTRDGKQLSYQQLTAFVGEFSEFIGGKHISEDMVRFMTGIWDEDVFEYKTRNKGKYKIPNPFFTMLGACTPDWIIRQLKADVVSDGFSRRTIFVYADQKNCSNPRPVLKPYMVDARDAMLKEAKRMFSISGEFYFSKEACEIFDSFYESLIEVEREAPNRLKHYFSTKPNLVQKVAMCLSACVSSSRIVDSHILNTTLRLFEQNEIYLHKIFGSMGRNELKAEMVKVLDSIRANGSAGKSDAVLIQEFYGDLNQKEITEVLDILKATGDVQVRLSQDGSSLVYSASEQLEARQEVHLLEVIGRLREPTEDPLIVAQAEAFPVPKDLKPEKLQISLVGEKPDSKRKGGRSGKPEKPRGLPLLVKGLVPKATSNPTEASGLDQI